jgi:cytochrome c-type biogenesis protein CcmE
MAGQNSKFIVGAGIILGVLAWLGISGYQESKTYYFTLPELRAQGDAAHSLRLRMAGRVVPGSIRRQQGQVLFTLYQQDDRLPVVYTGTEPLPDTLVDDAEAVVTGRYGRDNVFMAEQVQAKCASKYEALPPGTQPDSAAANRRTILAP